MTCPPQNWSRDNERLSGHWPPRRAACEEVGEAGSRTSAHSRVTPPESARGSSLAGLGRQRPRSGKQRDAPHGVVRRAFALARPEAAMPGESLGRRDNDPLQTRTWLGGPGAYDTGKALRVHAGTGGRPAPRSSSVLIVGARVRAFTNLLRLRSPHHPRLAPSPFRRSRCRRAACMSRGRRTWSRCSSWSSRRSRGQTPLRTPLSCRRECCSHTGSHSRSASCPPRC